ncbi:protein FAM183A [Platysternon megacephalum]|uniref:Protein FAM183A n=1 Tax=Platysternon megacephalum TaxID=55544 RepID=A0A4D9E8J8_9SAUR|nr:protein FAM183A [Platysternon megacephalum]
MHNWACSLQATYHLPLPIRVFLDSKEPLWSPYNAKGKMDTPIEMKQKLDEEGNKCSILSKQQKFNEHCCIRCCSPFTFLINSKRQCQDCKYNICKNCSSYQKKDKAWLCNVCQQARIDIFIYCLKGTEIPNISSQLMDLNIM